MRRTLEALTTLVLLATVLLDPYTRWLNASDGSIPAPSWQTALQLADAAFLVCVLALAARKMPRQASTVLALEAVYNLFLNFGFVMRDGVNRFSRGFGGEEYLSLYFIVIGIRVLLLFELGRHGLSAYSSREAEGR